MSMATHVLTSSMSRAKTAAEPRPPAKVLRDYLRDMALQLTEIARSEGYDQAAAYLALAALALRQASAETVATHAADDIVAVEDVDSVEADAHLASCGLRPQAG